MKDLEGKVALVTGGSRGIGKAVSLNLARRGSNVVIAYLRNRAAAEETIGLLEGEGVKAVAVRANVGDEAKLDALFDSVDETFGRLDIFVSNAATGVIKPVEDLDERAWRWTMDANARALLLGARRAAALMPDGGSMIAMSSGGATRVLPGYAVVGASKAAIEALVRYLGVELAPRIRVNAVSPGVVDTDALKHFPMRDEMLSGAKNKTPSGRLVTPEDVAGVVDFLTSDAAEMITGQTITIDGGAGLLA
ncbi:MAG: enoyl-[acyl-carrier-protein] reductase FabL [Actinobacteria bacterium]|nr:enoyl-[acyl-carrier-protein] reductase FabL [Actinomycetota bacterium]